MRHRSISTFLILVASLVAIPQASQQLLSFRSAVGDRLRSEIWSAFLSMHAQARESGIVPARARAWSAPAEMAKAVAARAPRAKKSAAAGRTEVASKTAAAAEHASDHLAMLDDPAHFFPGAKLDFDLAGTALEADAIEHFPPRHRGELPARDAETVMIIPPGDELTLPRVAAAAERESERAVGAVGRAHGLELRQLQKKASFVASRLREGRLEVTWDDAELRRQVDALVREGEKFRAAGPGAHSRALRVKKVAMPAAPAAPPACPTKPAAVAICPAEFDLAETIAGE